MKYEKYNFLKLRAEGGVLFVTIDTPPVDLHSLKVAAEFLRLSDEVNADNEVDVVIFDSENQDFLSHITMLDTWFNNRMKMMR